VAAHEGAWDVTVARGWVRFDPELNLHTDDFNYLGAAYNWTDDWAFELSVTQAEADPKYIAGDASQDNLGLTARYSVWDQHDVASAYLLAGLSTTDIDYEVGDSDYKETGLSVGAGVFYPITDWLRLRVEASQHFYSEDNVNDFKVFLGANFIWGGRHTEHRPTSARTTQTPVATNLPAMNNAAFTTAAVVEKPKDSDGDGVFDALDKCPGTPAGIQVNAEGCGGLSEKVSIKLNIQFDTGKAEIKTNFAPELAKVADFLSKYPTAKAVIEGHTDASGNPERNQILSQRRANAVMAAIVKDFGIAADRVSAVGYGADRPIADNNTKEGRAQNRRVTAEIEDKVTIQK
jgi:OOP family OmpA-OmpF porin